MKMHKINEDELKKLNQLWHNLDQKPVSPGKQQYNDIFKLI